VRGFQMEKGVDFDDSFSPTQGLAVGRFMLSLAVANDYELHACGIEQAFLQADKLPEGVNGRYFIQPPPGSPSALAGWWRRLWAGSGCGGSGRAPGWCGWAVASLLRRCCGGFCWRPAISLLAQSVVVGEVG
jgi:hypothetical protein